MRDDVAVEQSVPVADRQVTGDAIAVLAQGYHGFLDLFVLDAQIAHDLFEEVVGDLRVEDEEIQKPMVALGEDRYRVAGDLSIRDWNGLLDRDVVPHEYETVGGYVFAILGRLPRVGDQVELGGGIVGEVSQVRGRRVWSVDLYVRTDASGVRQEGFV